MNTLTWGSDALSVKHMFFNKKFMIYVEGKEDVPFWDHRFSLLNFEQFEIQPVSQEEKSSGSGQKELLKLMHKITKGEIKNTVIASDKDYGDFLIDHIIDCKQIVYTPGYSFENSMFCENGLNAFIKLRLRDNSIDEVKFLHEWFDSELKKLIPIIALDILNEKHQKGIKIIPNGQYLFVFKNNGKSHMVSEDRVNTVFQKYINFFELNEVNELIEMLKKKDLKYIIRGHALSGIVRNVLEHCIAKHKGDKSISNNEVLEHFVQRCQMRCNCKDTQYFQSSIMEAVLAIQ